MTKKRKKICFAASSGGHLEQLLTLSQYMVEYDQFFVTEKTDYTSIRRHQKAYYLKQVNRKELLFPLFFLWDALKSLVIMIKERPDVVITTGVLAVIPLALIAKIMRKRLIYIESYAKITDATLSGKLLYKFADDFYVQWEEMLEVFPNAKFVGGIY